MINYLISVAIFILIFIILTQSYNLVLGYTGILHVGHVAFMAIGAYTSAILTRQGVPFEIATLCGIGLAALIGLILGHPAIRLKEDYLVIATLGLGEIVRSILINWTRVTRGPLGLPGIPQPTVFGIKIDTNWEYLVFIGLIALAVNIFVYRLTKSPFGRVLETIREDEIASASIGKNTSKYKLIALVLGAAIAGLAGVLDAHFITFTEPTVFNINRMIFVLLIVMVGGAGNFWGAIIGTVILYNVFELTKVLPFPPSILGPMRWMLYAVVLVLVMIFKPTGIMGEKLLRKKY